MKRVEQISPHDGGRNSRRFSKRIKNRTLRRLGKRLLEDAPTRVQYMGYTL